MAAILIHLTVSTNGDSEYLHRTREFSAGFGIISRAYRGVCDQIHRLRPQAKNERELGGLWRPFQMQLLNQSTASPLLTLPMSMRKTPNKNIPTPSTTKLMFAPHRALIRDL